MKHSIPIEKNGDWERLKAIPSSKITTRIILTARMEITDSRYSIRNGIYEINNLKVEFQYNGSKFIFQTKGKIIEPEYDPNKMPDKELMPLELPNIVSDWFNEILKQNNIPDRVDNMHWTHILVFYLLKREAIAIVQYPKVIKKENGVVYDFKKLIFDDPNSIRWK